MRKVLVLGSTGMLGHQVVLRLAQNPDFEVFDLSFKNKFREETIICDVTDFDKLAHVIADVQPDFIINCIGILIKGSNENPKNSILINAYLPHFLAAQGDKIGAKVVHISTDCVFSGKKGGYLESDFRDADDVYGRGKALGEINSDSHLTLRTSIIGPELKENGEGLFHWIMSQKGKVNGFSKSIWGGVTTLELAKAIEISIEQNAFGLIHITNKIPISKFELLCLIIDVWKLKNVEIRKVPGKLVNKSLNSEKEISDYFVPGYLEMMIELHQWMLINSSMYSRIYSNLHEY